MSNAVVRTPYEPIIGLNALGLTGKLYIGEENLDPKEYPKAIFWDLAGTISASQPIPVQGGYPMYDGSPAKLYTDGRFSILAETMGGVQVWLSASEGPDGDAAVKVLPILDEGEQITGDAQQINFVGEGVEATSDGSGNVTITVPGVGSLGDLLTYSALHPFKPVAFQAGLADNIDIPINNGYSANGGWYITFHRTLIDTHGGMSLAEEYGSLENASVQSQHYNSSTSYICQLPGIYEVHLSVYIYGGPSQANGYQCGISLMDVDGSDILLDATGSSDWSYSAPIINLNTGGSIFDNGNDIACTAMIPVTLGQMIQPWFQRGFNDNAIQISPYATTFFGKRVAPFHGFEVEATGNEVFWADFANRYYREGGTVMAEAGAVTPYFSGDDLIFRARGILCAEQGGFVSIAKSQPVFSEALAGAFLSAMAAGGIVVLRFSLNGMATMHDAFEHNLLTFSGAETDGGSAATFSVKVARSGSSYSFKVYSGSNTYTQAFDGADGEHQLALWFEDGSHCAFAFDGGTVSNNVPAATTYGPFQAVGDAICTGADDDSAFSEHYLGFLSVCAVPAGMTTSKLQTWSRIGFDPHDIS